jgi:hypothetical protein
MFLHQMYVYEILNGI